MSAKKLIVVLLVLGSLMAVLVMLMDLPVDSPALDPGSSNSLPEKMEKEPVQRPPELVSSLKIELQVVDTDLVGKSDKNHYRNRGAGSSLRGWVTNEIPSPVDNVQLQFVAGLNKGKSAVSDKEGLYSFSGLFPGVHLLNIKSRLGSMLREVRLPVDQVIEKDFRFDVRSVVSGKVMDVKGEPLPSAKVEIDGKEGWTNQEGVFTLPDVLPGPAILYVKAKGFGYYRQTLDVPRNRVLKAENLKIVLLPGGTLRGGVYPVGGNGPAKLYLLPSITGFGEHPGSGDNSRSL